jgi:nicotinate-nucleotide adenylyltransferase
MARTAFTGDCEAEISDIEIADSGTHYTADTVALIMRDYPGAGFFLLMGTDMFLSLETWRDCGTLLKAVTPAVFCRRDGDGGVIADYARELENRYGVRTVSIGNNVIDISSSQLRAMLPLRDGAKYLDESNYSYIIRGRLYGAKPDWGWLRGKAYAMLDPKRVPHVAGCEAEALRLAGRWGVDADDAREAAILHDITKKLDYDGNLRVLQAYAVSAADVKPEEGKLLHAMSGAAIARGEFGASDAVVGAIRWHTTGKAGMTALEKVMYLSDYIEQTRDFEGVDALRRLAYEDLDAAVAMGLELSVADMRERGIVPNRTTFDAIDDLKRRDDEAYG